MTGRTLFCIVSRIYIIAIYIRHIAIIVATLAGKDIDSNLANVYI